VAHLAVRVGYAAMLAGEVCPETDKVADYGVEFVALHICIPNFFASRFAAFIAPPLVW
jgi:hypothetical protein